MTCNLRLGTIGTDPQNALNVLRGAVKAVECVVGAERHELGEAYAFRLEPVEDGVRTLVCTAQLEYRDWPADGRGVWVGEYPVLAMEPA